MHRLIQLREIMTPVLDILGPEDATYHCDKCTRANERDEIVRHPVWRFRVLDQHRWDGARARERWVYFLWALRSDGHAVARYIGISKAPHLRSRWTRLPASEKGRYRTGQLLHHENPTPKRLERDFQDRSFAAVGGSFRIYQAWHDEILLALKQQRIVSAAFSRCGHPISSSGIYEFIKEFEAEYAQTMHQEGLRPWNNSRGDESILAMHLPGSKWIS
jgi:hypothetical protein